MSLRYKTAIVGASETTDIGVLPEMSETQLHIDGAVNAMQNAGIGVDQIDGISSTMNPAILANYLGIVPKWIDNTSVGGTSFLIHVRHAAAAIASGLATTVLITHGESGRSRVGVAGGRRRELGQHVVVRVTGQRSVGFATGACLAQRAG